MINLCKPAPSVIDISSSDTDDDLDVSSMSEDGDGDDSEEDYKSEDGDGDDSEEDYKSEDGDGDDSEEDCKSEDGDGNDSEEDYEPEDGDGNDREEDNSDIERPGCLSLAGELLAEEVIRLIRGGDLKKLKVDNCRSYLRNYGLRLTGTKPVLIDRIKQHLELKEGCSRNYNKGTFTIDCTGDVCKGDVVMFDQKVYEKYDMAFKSAAPVGTRTVAGRVVKESYGAQRQQHTFTVEVLWSTGCSPLAPMKQLLVKGRNLYKRRTLRQRWADEGKRRRSLMEKHERGAAARQIRATKRGKIFQGIAGQQKVARKTQKRQLPNPYTNTLAQKENTNTGNESTFGSGVPARFMIAVTNSHTTLEARKSTHTDFVTRGLESRASLSSLALSETQLSSSDINSRDYERWKGGKTSESGENRKTRTDSSTARPRRWPDSRDKRRDNWHTSNGAENPNRWANASSPEREGWFTSRDVQMERKRTACLADGPNGGINAGRGFTSPSRLCRWSNSSDYEKMDRRETFYGRAYGSLGGCPSPTTQRHTSCTSNVSFKSGTHSSFCGVFTSPNRHMQCSNSRDDNEHMRLRNAFSAEEIPSRGCKESSVEDSTSSRSHRKWFKPASQLVPPQTKSAYQATVGNAVPSRGGDSTYTITTSGIVGALRKPMVSSRPETGYPATAISNGFIPGHGYQTFNSTASGIVQASNKGSSGPFRVALPGSSGSSTNPEPSGKGPSGQPWVAPSQLITRHPAERQASKDFPCPTHGCPNLGSRLCSVRVCYYCCKKTGRYCSNPRHGGFLPL